MFGGFGIPELLIILFIIMIFFGVGKLPEIGKGLGEGIKNFKKASRGEPDSEKQIPEGESRKALEDEQDTQDEQVKSS